MERNFYLDITKCMAIISVIFYHLGYLQYGYLGVDVFFVIAGFLFFNKLIKDKGINYSSFFYSKFFRLYPLIVISCLICLFIGYYLMLPDDFENLGEAVVASSLFAENVLEAITTKNYWNVSNLYKPLMHLWYISVLCQIYLFFLVLSFLFKEPTSKGFYYSTLITTIISFIICFFSDFPQHWKFYYLPFRLFEFSLCGVISILIFIHNYKLKLSNFITYISIIILFISFFLPAHSLFSKDFRLFFVVLSTTVLVFSLSEINQKNFGRILNTMAFIGKMSYSIYIWHQVLIAFLCYSFFEKWTWYNLFLFFFLLSLLTLASFYLFEVRLINFSKVVCKKICVIMLIGLSILSILLGFTVYYNAGVFKDIYELDISKENIHRGMHATYVDGPYKWNYPFALDNKVKILVLGNSFGRDFANILNESNYKYNLQIRYLFPDLILDDKSERLLSSLILEADIVFVALGPKLIDINEELKDKIPKEKLFVIGTKKFGISNGIVYSNRNKDDYYMQYAKVSPDLIEFNNKMKDLYKDKFVDMINPVAVSEDEVRIFTDNNKFISQDTSHLTRAGAIYYSKILPLHKFIK